MLDLLITYINFLILSIKYIVKRLVFRPPNPISYKIIETSIGGKKNTEIYVKNYSYKYYHKVKKKVQLDIEFHKIPDKHNNNIPIFIFKPTLFIHSACIIYCHGTSGDIGSTFTLCCDLVKLTKCIVVNFDYPGYGIYQNVELNEKNFYHTVQIIYEYVKEQLKFDEKNIIVYGFSLGTGVAFDLACNEKYKFAGLILQSPFLSIIRTMYNIKKTEYFDFFNNCDKAKLLKIKTLFIHGNEDKIVPYIHGRILSKLIPQNQLFGFKTVKGAGHNNIFSLKNLASLSEVIRCFIGECCNLIQYKGNITVRNKEIREINFNIETTQINNNSFSGYINDNNLLNISMKETRKNDKKETEMENEKENRSFSENNSNYISKKKESFVELLKNNNNEESRLIRMPRYLETEDEKNYLDSADKFIRTEKRTNKRYSSNFSYKDFKSPINMIDKTERNIIIDSNNIKTMNITESSIIHKDIFNNIELKILDKKINDIPIQNIIDVSKTE